MRGESVGSMSGCVPSGVPSVPKGIRVRDGYTATWPFDITEDVSENVP